MLTPAGRSLLFRKEEYPPAGGLGLCESKSNIYPESKGTLHRESAPLVAVDQR